MGFNTKFIFALSLFTHNCCNSSNYKEYDLTRDSVCKNELNVGQGNRSSIVVKHWGELEDWNGKKDFECTFFVKANFEMGLFAVIQKMNLRRDQQTNVCIDYIKFRHGKKKNWIVPTVWIPKKESPWSSPICGKVERLEEPLTVTHEAASLSKETVLAPHAYEDANGDIEVKIKISKQKIQDFPFRELMLVIAFTSFKECKNEQGGYRSCGHNTCIYKDYFDDKTVNCPYINCEDEPQCPDFVYGDKEGSGLSSTKVTITAVSTIFLSFFLFLGCIMFCRYMELLCWSGAGGNNTNTDRETELTSRTPIEPSAPPISSPDKDLPPAYETLFPGD